MLTAHVPLEDCRPELTFFKPMYHAVLINHRVKNFLTESRIMIDRYFGPSKTGRNAKILILDIFPDLQLFLEKILSQDFKFLSG